MNAECLLVPYSATWCTLQTECSRGDCLVDRYGARGNRWLSIWACKHLARIVASGDGLGDRTCEHLAGCSTLREICLGGRSITGYGLRQIGSLPLLRTLNVMRNALSSSDVIQLGPCLHLEDLCLCDTHIDDGVVEFLAGLPALKTLDISRTKVSRKGVALLAKRDWTMFYHD